MSAQESKKIVEDAFGAMSRGDSEGFMQRLSDDIRWTIIGTTRYSGTYAGKQQLVERLLTPIMADLESGIRQNVQNVIAEGDTVVVQTQGESMTKSGKPYNNTYCLVIRVADDKIAELTEYLDTELVTEAFWS